MSLARDLILFNWAWSCRSCHCMAVHAVRMTACTFTSGYTSLLSTSFNGVTTTKV